MIDLHQQLISLLPAGVDGEAVEFVRLMLPHLSKLKGVSLQGNVDGSVTVSWFDGDMKRMVDIYG